MFYGFDHVPFCMYILLLIFQANLCSYGVCCSGFVQIVNSPYPLYVKAGTNLSLICQNQDASAISWIQQTPQTSWMDASIVARSSQDIVIQDCHTQGVSSDVTQSTLTRSNMSLNSRGTYICTTGPSSYAVWVTVIYSQYIKVSS